MASISDGSYIIVSSLNTSCAIDCYGSQDANGANVWLYTRNLSDAQFIHVTTNSDGSRRLIFALSGKSIDIDASVIADGTNVQQYADNYTRAQKWAITDSGATITISSTTYNLFSINVFSSTGFCLDVDAGQGVSGTNIQIYHTNSTAAQRWAFIPCNPVPTGTYLIRSVLDTNSVMEVAAGSTANGATIQLYGLNQTNAQIWRVVNYDSSGLAGIVNTNSSMYLDVYANTTTDGTNLQQWAAAADSNKWFLQPVSTMHINGVSVPTYTLRFLSGTGKVADCADGGTTAKTKVKIYEYSGTASQQWAFQPFSMLASGLPVPASIHIGTSAGTDSGTIVTANNVSTFYPSWLCSGTDYQVRIRARTRSIGGTLGEWQNWKSIADGTTANNGWGDIGIANCVTSNTSRKYSTKGITGTVVNNTSVDYAELQVEARRYDNAYNGTSGLEAHGNSCTETFKLVWKPTLTINSVEWSPDGITVSYTSDYKRDGNTIQINTITSNGKTLCGTYSFSACPYTGSVTVPVKYLNFTPTDGAAIEASVTIITDVSSSTDTSGTQVDYNENQGLTVTPKYTLNDDCTITVNTGTLTDAHCYLIYNGEQIECEGSESGFILIPPLNEKYTVMITASDGTQWGSFTEAREAVKFHGYVWNWDGKCTIIRYNKDEAPSYSDDQEIDSAEEITTGRDHPVYRFGKSVTRKLNVEGVYSDLVPHNSSSDMDALCLAKHALFRTPYGSIRHTAILGVSKKGEGGFRSRLGEWGTVTVDQREETP